MEENKEVAVDEVTTNADDDYTTEDATYMGYITETIVHEVILFDEKYKGLNGADTMTMLADDWYHGRIDKTNGRGTVTF